MNRSKPFFMLPTMVGVLGIGLTGVLADDPVEAERDDLHEPVYRVTKQDPVTAPAALVTKPAQAAHPLDNALNMANAALERSRNQVNDYTAILVKRERVNGRLNDPSYMFTKIRNEKRDPTGRVKIPFSVYLKFLRPGSVSGREVIFVEGRNNGKLIAHEGGLKGRITPSLYLDPNGTLAMMGQRYPINDIGIENLCVKLIERGTRDRAKGPCSVTVQPVQINKRPTTRVEVVHPQKQPHLDFHLARIFVDDEYQLPVRYEAYGWPRKNGAGVSENELIEEYTYVNLKFNVGLTDLDFDHKNPAYKMN